MLASAAEHAPAARPLALQASGLSMRAVLPIVGFVAIWGFSLSRGLFDPIGFDQGMYQYMAERVMAGDRLYVDVWDQNGPGIIAIHCLSTILVGTSPLAHHVFDAVWQALTLVALIALVVRDRRGWTAAWCVATLYVLSYYSLSYIQTAQREGFAVLPTLLSLHLVAGIASDREQPRWLASRSAALSAGLRCGLAGVLCLFVVAIKTPLGLFFAAVWAHLLVRGWKQRRQGPRGFMPWAALSAGFLLAAAVVAGLFVRWGWWEGFWGIFSRRDIPGYVVGPGLIRQAAPALLAGLALFAGIGWAASRMPWGRGGTPALQACAVAFAMFAVLLTARRWPGWQNLLMCFGGLFVPAAGGMASRAWSDRSEIWRLAVCMLAAATGSLVLQGQFFPYHVPPILAAAAYLAGVEIVERAATLGRPEHRASLRVAVYAGGLAYLAVGQWWPTMSFVTATPNVLAGTTLSAHYDAITKHKLNCPTYTTTVKVADRIRELTAENDPIATLFHEARIYCFSRRPSVHKLLSTHVSFRHMFPAYMQAIRDRKPKVIAARIPQRLRKSHDVAAIQSAVYDEAESCFGPPAAVIRECYRVTDVIDDVCLLTPVRPSPGDARTRAF